MDITYDEAWVVYKKKPYDDKLFVMILLPDMLPAYLNGSIR